MLQYVPTLFTETSVKVSRSCSSNNRGCHISRLHQTTRKHWHCVTDAAVERTTASPCSKGSIRASGHMHCSVESECTLPKRPLVLCICIYWDGVFWPHLRPPNLPLHHTRNKSYVHILCMGPCTAWSSWIKLSTCKPQPSLGIFSITIGSRHKAGCQPNTSTAQLTSTPNHGQVDGNLSNNKNA